jgi:RNAse (barnase) inhibitor barstar
VSAPDLTRPAADPASSVHEAGEPPDRDELEAAGIRVAEIDGAAVESKQDLMSALSDALELPDYFGGNWDALDEVLRDLAWLEARGHVLLVTGADRLRERQPELVLGLTESWSFSSERWIGDEVPFHLVLVRTVADG